jgi:hypothetical protein
MNLLKLQFETMHLQLGNQQWDAFFFPNYKSVIKINANENDFFFVPIQQQSHI